MSYDSNKTIKYFRDKACLILKEYSVPRWMVFLQDGLALFLVFIFSYMIRYNFIIADINFRTAILQALMTFLIFAVFSLIFRPYSGIIRHTTIIDIYAVFLTTTCTSLTMAMLAFADRWIGLKYPLAIPLSINLINYVTITLLLFLVRLIIKILYQSITDSVKNKKKVVIFGADDTGVEVKNVLQSDCQSSFEIAGFIEKNKMLQGKNLNGISVYRPGILTANFIKKNHIETLIFASKSISPAEKSDILRKALNLGLEVLDTPSVDTWLNGHLQIRQIQKVKLEDLLGRDPIKLNLKRISIGLTGKTIMVTGAAGSIGSEISRQLTRFNSKKLILVDQAETPVFHLENEIRSLSPQCHVEIQLADVTNLQKMELIFNEFRPELVFHAAAYKHVPLMEGSPHEAVHVNVGGTKIIARLALKYGVRKFVLISSDKAVNPTNVMGASKRMCEILVQLISQNPGIKTQFITTRFGNVLGSNGSVIPIFARQIENGGPVTVTHPEITRYFMTIPEACQLVMEAGFIGQGGEIFEFDMGKPVKIIDLAYHMIQLSGFVPDKDIKVVFTGLRPGEKLYEELLTDKEITEPTHHPKIRIVRTKKKLQNDHLDKIDELLKNLYRLSKYEVIACCSEIVPEYKSTNDQYAGITEGYKVLNNENQEEESILQH